MLQIAKLKKVDKKVVSDSVAWLQNSGIMQTRMEKKEIFSNTKMNFTNSYSEKKKHIKRLGDLSSFHVSFHVMVLKFSKKLQFCAELCKKSKFVKTICIYMHLKVPIALFQKIIWFVGV